MEEANAPTRGFFSREVIITAVIIIFGLGLFLVNHFSSADERYFGMGPKPNDELLETFKDGSGVNVYEVSGDWRATLEQTIGTTTPHEISSWKTGNFYDDLIGEYLAALVSGNKSIVDPKKIIESHAENQGYGNTSYVLNEDALKFSDAKSREEYLLSMYEIFQQMSLLSKKENAYLNELMATESTKHLSSLGKEATFYEGALDNIIALEAPTALKVFHTASANLMLRYVFALRALEHFDADPVQGTIAFGKYMELEADRHALLLNYNALATQQ